MPSVATLKASIEVSLKEELNLWETGQRRWNVSNQHDRYVLKSAIETLSDDVVVKLVEKRGTIDFSRYSVMDLAHSLSEFEAPEIDSAWID